MADNAHRITNAYLNTNFTPGAKVGSIQLSAHFADGTIEEATIETDYFTPEALIDALDMAAKYVKERHYGDYSQ